MSEIIKSYNSIDEYLADKNLEKINNMYREAADQAIGKKVVTDMIPEAIRELSDAEAELNILEDLFVLDKVNKKEVTLAKRRLTKARNSLESLYKEESELN